MKHKLKNQKTEFLQQAFRDRLVNFRQFREIIEAGRPWTKDEIRIALLSDPYIRYWFSFNIKSEIDNLLDLNSKYNISEEKCEKLRAEWALVPRKTCWCQRRQHDD